MGFFGSSVWDIVFRVCVLGKKNQGLAFRFCVCVLGRGLGSELKALGLLKKSGCLPPPPNRHRFRCLIVERSFYNYGVGVAAAPEAILELL